MSVLPGVGALFLVASYSCARRGSRVREVLAARPEPAAPREASGGD